MFTLYIYSNCTVLNGKCIFFENHQKVTEKKTSDIMYYKVSTQAYSIVTIITDQKNNFKMDIPLK